MIWIGIGIILVISAILLFVNSSFKDDQEKFGKTVKVTAVIVGLAFLVGVGVSRCFPPEFISENIELVSEKTLKVYTSEQIIYIDGFGSYIYSEDYLLALEDNTFYDIHTFDEICDGKSESYFYVIRSDREKEFKLLDYNYKNTWYFCNWVARPISVLVIPASYEP